MLILSIGDFEKPSVQAFELVSLALLARFSFSKPLVERIGLRSRDVARMQCEVQM
jgi:hypothetical protein